MGSGSTPAKLCLCVRGMPRHLVVFSQQIKLCLCLEGGKTGEGAVRDGSPHHNKHRKLYGSDALITNLRGQLDARCPYPFNSLLFGEGFLLSAYVAP